MLRHHLAPLFEPVSLLVLSQRRLPIMRQPPDLLRQAVTCVHLPEDMPSRDTPLQNLLPEHLSGVPPGQRLDLALICAGSAWMPALLQAIKAYRPRVLVLLSAGQAVADTHEDLMFCRSWGRLNDCAVLGPRSFGMQRPVTGLNLSHVPHMARVGRVALVAQSGSLVAALLDWAMDVSLGFSVVVSLGHEAGIDTAQVLDYLVNDPQTDSIALYLKETPNMRRLSSALRAASVVKPVVVLRPRHRGPDGLLAADDAVFDALLHRTGAVRVPYFIQLFSALKILRYKNRLQGRRVAVVSNSAGAAQLALDVMGPGFATERASLSQGSMRQLSSILSPGSAVANPVLCVVPVCPEMLEAVIGILLEDSGVDGVLVLFTPDPLADMQAATGRLAALADRPGKPVVACLIGEASMRSLRQQFDVEGLPVFRTPESAASAFGVQASYHYNQELSRQILPPEVLGRAPRIDSARNILVQARRLGRRYLLPAECQQLLRCFYVSIDVAAADDGQYIEGPTGHTLSDEPAMAIRVRQSPGIGPYICFGTAATPLSPGHGDALELPPLNSFLARQLIERSSLWKQVLEATLSPDALHTLIDALQCVSDLVSMLPDIDSITISPLFASSMSLSAGHIEIDLAEQSRSLPETSGYPHMAIHPYPRELVQNRQFHDGRKWLMRPIRPEDAEPLQEFVRGLSHESRYMRFVSMLRELTPRMLSRYTRIDYDRELAIVAAVSLPNPRHRGHFHEQIVGFAHFLCNADGHGAEIALVVGDDWQRLGMGGELLSGLIAGARLQGLGYLDGHVLATNVAMLKLMTGLGFEIQPVSDDPEMRHLVLPLR